MSLYEALVEMGYTPDEAEETLIRLECGMELPEKVQNDLRKIWAIRSIN